MENLTDFRSIDLEQTGRLLRRIEAHHDAQGWHPDPHCHVYAVHDHHDVVTAAAMHDLTNEFGSVSNSRYTARLLIGPAVFDMAHRVAGIGTMQALWRFAMNIAYGDSDLLPAGAEWVGERTERFRKAVRMPGVLGFVVAVELYGAPRDEVRCAFLAGRHVETAPSRYEARDVTMVDTADRVHEMYRVRGKPAVLGLDTGSFGGVVSIARMLTDMAMDRLPRTQAEFEARYPSGREAAMRGE